LQIKEGKNFNCGNTWGILRVKILPTTEILVKERFSSRTKDLQKNKLYLLSVEILIGLRYKSEV